MQKYDLTRDGEKHVLRVPKDETGLISHPLYNKGAGFTAAERQRFGLEGRLPAEINDIDTQAERVFNSIMFNPDPVGRHIELAALQDRNEHLYYKLLEDHLEELMPIVYTPTVGKASQYFSRVFRRARGVWITPQHVGRIETVLRNAAPFTGVQLMVVTDNEAILGIGDQGAGGMAISVGKLALYCAGAGIHPARTLPISLDVGTDNEDLLADPLYLGFRERRLRGDQYMELLDEFVAAAKSVFPGVMIQWEDFRKDNALSVLDRFRTQVSSFNDDIQGTGAVAYACIQVANKIRGEVAGKTRVLIYGAGAAGYGIAQRIMTGLEANGVTGADLARSILAMDSRGIIDRSRSFTDYKNELAWPVELSSQLGLAERQRADLVSVVEAYKPTVLIGTSGQYSAFDENVVKTMAKHCDRPVILPMSNPTDISEAIPEDVLRWTGGKALVATGSPFDPVPMRGATLRIGQANNVFIFPGLGLGTIIVRATEVTDGMINAASQALANSLSEEELARDGLMPAVNRLWDISGQVALATAEQAMDDGVAPKINRTELKERLENYRWRPVYPEIVEY